MVQFSINPVGVANGEKTDVNVDPNATVSDVINQLMDNKKVPRGRYMLQFGGQPLNAAQKIKDTNIKDNDEVKLLVDTKWG